VPAAATSKLLAVDRRISLLKVEFEAYIDEPKLTRL
jgi:hypothetical protein